MNSIIYYDFETTGLNPFHSNIIEYAFLNDYIEDNGFYQIMSLINPNRKIQDKITKITGIDDNMVKDETFIENHRDRIFNFIKTVYNRLEKNSDESKYVYLIAHNNDGFDRFFLKRIFKENNSQLLFINKHVRFIDSLLLSKLALPHMRSNSLKTLSKYFGVPEGTHRSLSDTKTLKLVYMKIVNEYCKQNDLKFSDVYNNPNLIFNHIYN